MHHRLKKDAPSGTAARLLEIILEERKLDRAALRHGREGITGERARAEVGVALAARGGDVVGDHTVIFAGQRRAHRVRPPGQRPGHIRARGPARRAVGRRPAAGGVRHAGRARAGVRPPE